MSTLCLLIISDSQMAYLEEDKTTALNVLRALSTNSSEFLAGCASSLLPYIFLATCQQGDCLFLKLNEKVNN